MEHAAKKLLDFIGDLEAPRGYDTIYGNNQGKLKKKPTEMTVNEVLSAQNLWRKRWGNSAAGRYQFIPTTLRGLKNELRLSGSERFDEELQDRLAMVLLRRRGYDRFMAGKLSVKSFGNELAKEWASLPVLAPCKRGAKHIARGQSYYGGIAGNKSLTNADKFERVIESLQPKGDRAMPRAQPVMAAPTTRIRRDEHWISEKRIRLIQKLLYSKGWTEVGIADGIWGPNTIAAIGIFVREKKMPSNTVIDAAFLEFLKNARPRKLPESRRKMTETELEARGSRTIPTAKRGGLGAAIGVGATTVGGIGAVAEKVEQANTIAGGLRTPMELLVDFWYLFPIIGGIVGAAYAAWKFIDIRAFRLDQEHTNRTVTQDVKIQRPTKEELDEDDDDEDEEVTENA